MAVPRMAQGMDAEADCVNRGTILETELIGRGGTRGTRDEGPGIRAEITAS